MKLSKIFSILTDLRLSIIATLKPTLKEILNSPLLLFHPRELSKIIFYNVWITYGHAANEGGRAIKEVLITTNARGVVLDLGAGNTIFEI